MNGQEGMSLRDYFAAEALGAILSHERNIIALAASSESPHGYKSMAVDAFKMADAMLAARAL